MTAVRQKHHRLENDVLNVGEHNADTFKKQTKKLPLQLRTHATVLSSVQRETQMHLKSQQHRYQHYQHFKHLCHLHCFSTYKYLVSLQCRKHYNCSYSTQVWASVYYTYVQAKHVADHGHEISTFQHGLRCIMLQLQPHDTI